jgi:biopolymer transport protein ExbD
MKIRHIFPFAISILVMGCTQPAQSQSSLPPAMQHFTVSELDKVVVGGSGEIFVNKKQVSLAEFVAECQRLKKAGGGAVVCVVHGNQDTAKIQIEVIIKLMDAGVPFIQDLKESDLD